MSEHVNRSAESGQFVSDEEAEANPATTVRETLPGGGGPRSAVGRVVHYVSFGTPGGEYTSQCRAAIIAEVVDEQEGVAALAVLNPTGVFFNECVYSSDHEGGTWHWPERV